MPLPVSELVTEIPFRTKEPEIYQTDVVITSGGTARKIFTARRSARRVTIFDADEKDKIARLELDA
ncbi:MAG: hypothetical protein ACR2L1_11365, partial [Pyrinomonadaceae bacterium]